MDIIAALDHARSASNVLEHPFYLRWNRGELSAEELQRYAHEYRHAVIAIADVSRQAAECAAPERRDALHAHALEERAHLAMWDRFLEAVLAAAPAAERAGADAGAHAHRLVHAPGSVPAPERAPAHAPAPALAPGPEPLAQTRSCTAAWGAGSDLLERLAILYCIEAGQPAVSASKIHGLVEHYGYSPDSPALEYFRVHTHLDVHHARQARELIGQLICGAPQGQDPAERMLARGRDALRANWLLLDGVEAAAR